MGLTKQYLAFKPLNTFNIIASGRPNINFVVYNNIEGRYVLVGTAENATIWDLRLGQKILDLKRNTFEVTALRSSPDKTHAAVGYADGVVEIFNLESQKSMCSLSVHKNAVTVLRYDTIGTSLVSGGMDTELVISDVIVQSGKHRLIGHNAPVTDAHFLDSFTLNNVLVSSSKDTQIKFWNIDTQMCFRTLVDNRTEIWSLAIVEEFLIAGSSDNIMNVYKMNEISSDEKSVTRVTTLIEGLIVDDESTISPLNVKNCGTIQRVGKGRTVNILIDNKKKLLVCHGTNNLIELFYFYSRDETQTRLMRRLKKQKNNVHNGEDSSKEPNLVDKIKRLTTIKVSNKIKSIDLLNGESNEVRIVISTSDNCLHLYSLKNLKKKTEAKLLRSVDQCGHRSEVRSLVISSDSLVIASGSGESLKIWNKNSVQCIRTIPTSYILCLCFVPGDRYILAGLKSGKLLIVDISNCEILEEIPAHQNELWSMCLLPNSSGCVTGSTDTTVKIWSFELIEDQKLTTIEEIKRAQILSLLHKRTLKLEEAVTSVKVSANSKFLAVGLLDSTVKIFFIDSLKFFLSLYGHKLPILCMDISYDSNLMATGSADRNVKIWGMDFGNCHQSIFAHDDSVMSLQFIPKTHMFFTCGKDGKIKQWDGDTFQKIITLPGHIGESYGLAISLNGKFVVTCGSDRTIRLFERTDEVIVLQDVQEEEREEYENKILATGENNIISTIPSLNMASRKTVGSEKAVESILECLHISKTFENDKSNFHPLMTTFNVKNVEDLIIITLERIRASDLEEALAILPFTSVCQLLEYIPKIVKFHKNQSELVCKITVFLFRIHYKPIVSNHILFPVIREIISCLKEQIYEIRDMIGRNFYSIQIIQKELEELEGLELFKDAYKIKKQCSRKLKKKHLLKRLYVQMN